MSSRNVLHAIGLIVATPMLALPKPRQLTRARRACLVAVPGGGVDRRAQHVHVLLQCQAARRVDRLCQRCRTDSPADRPRHTDSLHFYADKKASKIDWQVTLVIGVIVGAFLAAWSGGEITGRWLPPMWAERFGEVSG